MKAHQLIEILCDIVSELPSEAARKRISKKIDAFGNSVKGHGKIYLGKYNLETLTKVGDYTIIPFDKSQNQRNRIAAYVSWWGSQNNQTFTVRTEGEGYVIQRTK